MQYLFLLKLNFFYLLSLIIAHFQLVLTTGLHLHLISWIIYVMRWYSSILPFFLILSFQVISTLISTLLHPQRLTWISYLTLLTLSKLVVLPIILSLLYTIHYWSCLSPIYHCCSFSQYSSSRLFFRPFFSSHLSSHRIC